MTAQISYSPILFQSIAPRCYVTVRGPATYGVLGILKNEATRLADYSAGSHPRAKPAELFASLYEDLRRIARRELRRMGNPAALGTTTLVHEAYLNLHDRAGVQFPDRAHFLAYASRAMRGLIIDAARTRQALKRGSAMQFVSLTGEIPQTADEADSMLLRLNDAVEKLASFDQRLCHVTELRYFGGFSFSEIGALCGLSERTAERDWQKARTMLRLYMSTPEKV